MTWRGLFLSAHGTIGIYPSAKAGAARHTPGGYGRSLGSDWERGGAVIGRRGAVGRSNLRGGTGKIGILRAVRPHFLEVGREKGISGVGSLEVN